ncbi:hypothetical protein [Arthrobacter sp. JCM 19049]|uniref:hypothetical protein n=1 Tax=Arthrobacter sp. JCM 19049 TaxID=1460643 RepID=UPI00243681D1|nr:hypothetical protein [Arthrobacter sp. JCM 19049]
MMLAQRFAQQRAGARGALLLESFVDPQAPWSSGPWPSTVPVQIHGMADDPFFAHEGDLDAAQQFVQGPGAGWRSFSPTGTGPPVHRQFPARPRSAGHCAADAARRGVS